MFRMKLYRELESLQEFGCLPTKLFPESNKTRNSILNNELI